VIKSLQQDLNAYCAYLGEDPLMVQGAGGNASWKSEDTLWIKASGTLLAEAAVKDIFVPVDLRILRKEISSGKSSIVPHVIGDSALRPSIETVLHAVMPQKVVMHLHAVNVLATLVQSDFRDCLHRKLQNYPDLQWAAVDYYKPGSDLAQAISQALIGNPKIQIVFLKNHGIVLGAQSVAELDALLERVNSIFDAPIVEPEFMPMPNQEKILGEFFSLLEDKDLHILVLSSRIFTALKTAWALYPDHVVFLGASPNLYDSVSDFYTQLASSQEIPNLAFIKDVGIYAKEEFSNAKLTQLRCYFNVMQRIERFEGINTLSPQQIAELLNWDAEKYRQGLQSQ